MQRLLDRPRLALALVVLLGLVLHAHSLTWGFVADDHAILATLEGEFGVSDATNMGPASLYDFGALPAVDDPLYAAFSPPWWADADWKVRFFRPLTSLSLALDHALFGRNAVGWHATGLLLYALLLVACHGLYRALGLSRGLALGALLLFVCDDGSYVPVGWLANRNTLLEALFLVLSIWALASAERLGRGRATLLAFVAALGALGSKESGVAIAALIPAYLFLVPQTPDGGAEGVERRPKSAWPTALAAIALGLAFLTFLLVSGYGAKSLFYPTPWAEPAQWFARLVFLLPASAHALTAPAPLDVLVPLPEAKPVFVLLGGAVALFLGRALWRELHARPATRFLMAWVLLTLLPRVGAPPSDRLLFVPNVAAAALFAQLIAAAPRPLLANLRRSSTARWATYLLVVTGVLSGLSLWPNSLVFLQVAEEGRSAIRDAEVPAPELGARDVVLLQLPNTLAGLQPQAVRRMTSADSDLAFWSLQYGRRGLRLERTGPTTLVVTSLGTPFASSTFEQVFRTRPGPLAVDRAYPSRPYDAQVLEAEGDGARRVRFEFERDLDDPRLALATWRDGSMRRVAPPRVGETVELEEVVPPMPLWP